MFEIPSACSVIPVQCIACKCARAVLPIKIGVITENLFVACPVPMKYSVIIPCNFNVIIQQTHERSQ